MKLIAIDAQNRCYALNERLLLLCYDFVYIDDQNHVIDLELLPQVSFHFFSAGHAQKIIILVGKNESLSDKDDLWINNNLYQKNEFNFYFV